MDLAELGIKATTTGVKEAGADLDRLSGSAAKAQGATDGFVVGAGKASTASGVMSRAVSGLGASFATMGPLAIGAITALAGFAAAAVSIDAFVAATVDAENQQAQLAAALKSTGGVSGQTLDSLNKLSSELQALTNYEDDTIAKSQTLLLTFTKIGGDIFPKASKAILDLAQRMGGDLQGATLQVGKALNNPIQGITALSRAGIQFTEEQKNMIKGFVATNQVVKAQEVILKELENQFGGSAEAARATLGGALTSLQNAFGNLFEVSGPVVEKLRLGIEDLIKALSSDAFKDFANTVGTVIFEGLVAAVNGLTMFTKGVADFWAYAGPTIKEFASILWELAKVVIPAIGSAFLAMWEVVKPVIQYFLEGYRKIYDVAKQVYDIIANTPDVPAVANDNAAAVKPSAAVKASADAVEDAVNDGFTKGADTTQKAIEKSTATASNAAAKTTIDTAAQASAIGSKALTNSFGEGASTVGSSIESAASVQAAQIEAAGNVMAAKFEGTGRNIYDLWNNWGNSFVNSFGTTLGDLLVKFQNAQTEQLRAQAALLRAQANLTNEQAKSVRDGQGMDGTGGSGGSSTGGLGGSGGSSGGSSSSFSLSDENLYGKDRKRRDRNTGSSTNTGRGRGRGTEDDKLDKLDERGNISFKVINKTSPKDTLDDLGSYEGGRTIINNIGRNRHAVRRILGVSG